MKIFVTIFLLLCADCHAVKWVVSPFFHRPDRGDAGAGVTVAAQAPLSPSFTAIDIGGGERLYSAELRHYAERPFGHTRVAGFAFAGGGVTWAGRHGDPTVSAGVGVRRGRIFADYSRYAGSSGSRSGVLRVGLSLKF